MDELMKKSYLRSMKNMADAITGLNVTVIDCPMSQGVAFCCKKKKEVIIAVCFDQPFDDLTPEETRCILYGLFAHEVMHLILTDFKYSSDWDDKYPALERKDRHDIFNICEDPSIEWFSSNYISSFLAGCLNKQIEYYYRHSPQIQECGDDAYLQYIAAMIMFGDMGVLKGNFTFKKARDAFIKTAPMMLKIIEEPDGKKRFDLSQQIFEIIKPLWEEHQDKLYANAETQELLNQMGVTNSSGDEDSGANGSLPGKDDQAALNRRELSKILKRLESTDVKDDSSISEIPDFSDVADLFGNTGRYSPQDMQLDKPFEIPEQLKQKAEDAFETARKVILQEQRDEEEKNMWEKKPYIHSPYYGDILYNVSKVDGSDPVSYQMALERLKPNIANFKALLRKQLNSSYTKKEYKTSGKLNVGRYCGKKITARVFDRRIMPDNKQDLSIMILVDQSGSMRGNIKGIKDTILLMLESFSNYNIPIKVIGFTTNSNKDADYFHYGDWKNNAAMRQSIPLIKANGSTFLGHAIRYAGSQLKKRPEKHKVFIVLTDGEPYHRRYCNNNDGFKDCRCAVKEIHKYADVIGIGFYSTKDDEELFKNIFKENAILMEDVSTLIRELPKQLGKILRN